MLTIARMHSESVAYYESTVDGESGHTRGPDGYYSEDGSVPARVFVASRTSTQHAVLESFLGVEHGAFLDGEAVQKWFNKTTAPSGQRLGRRLKKSGVPGFDATFCAPKSVSLVWGLGSQEQRHAVDRAHAAAVNAALAYLSEHAGYTRRGSDEDSSVMIIDRVEGLSGVRYEHRTSRAGDPHVHTHVLISNRQLCADGKVRTLDSKSLYHEARAAGMIYQAMLRAELSARLGVGWSDIDNGCAEIAGLDEKEVLDDFSTRAKQIKQWAVDNSAPGADGVEAQAERVAQKKTRQTKDLDTSLAELERDWLQRAHADGVREVCESFTPHPATDEAVLPAIGTILDAVIAERSTFTRADVVEKITEFLPCSMPAGEVLATAERLADEVFAADQCWTVTPHEDRAVNQQAREGSQRFTTENVVAEVDYAIERATQPVSQRVSGASIVAKEGTLSEQQAAAMRAIVESSYLASVLVAPAGAGKTSSLKAARDAWEKAGMRVEGLAPTGKAADVMVREEVADHASTIARLLIGADEMNAYQLAQRAGWDSTTVVVVDEAGMVGTPEMVSVMDMAESVGARCVFVGDPHQYGAVKTRGGLLQTLAYELPNAQELSEVWRQRDPEERRASQHLRNGDETLLKQAVGWYQEHGRLHAGELTAMAVDALEAWKTDVSAGYQSLLIACDNATVDELNEQAQRIGHGVWTDPDGPSVPLADGARGLIGETILTRRNNYQLETSSGDVVRNGQRWTITAINDDGSIHVTRQDETRAQAVLPAGYVSRFVRLGYASTGHAAQGVTVDTCHVVTTAGRIDRESVYVPITRGKRSNHLYIADTNPSDTAETGTLRRETSEYAAKLVEHLAARSRHDLTPHQLWRQAKLDWDLAALSTGHDVDTSPFAGTRMAQVMETRSTQRAQRFADHASQPAVETTPPLKHGPAQWIPTRVLEKLSADYAGFYYTALHYSDLADKVEKEHADAVKDAHRQCDQADRRLEETKRRLDEAEDRYKQARSEEIAADNEVDKWGLIGRLIGRKKAEEHWKACAEETSRAQSAHNEAYDRYVQARNTAETAHHAARELANTDIAAVSESYRHQAAIYTEITELTAGEVEDELTYRQELPAHQTDEYQRQIMQAWEEKTADGFTEQQRHDLVDGDFSPTPPENSSYYSLYEISGVYQPGGRWHTAPRRQVKQPAQNTAGNGGDWSILDACGIDRSFIPTTRSWDDSTEEDEDDSSNEQWNRNENDEGFEL